MPFGAAHAPSLAFFVFAGPDGLHRLEYLPVEVVEPLGDFVFWPEHDLDEKALEQACGDIAVRFVVVFPALADVFDFLLLGFEEHGLDVVIDKVGVYVLPAVVDGIGGEVGELEERLDDEEASLDAPSLGVDTGKAAVREAPSVGKCSEQHLGAAAGQRDPYEAVADGSGCVDVEAEALQSPA